MTTSPRHIATTLIAAVLLSGLVPGCSKPDHIGIRPDAARMVISVSDATKPENLGRVITIRGIVGSVCQDEGCWVTITDGSAEIKMRFTDGSLGVPMDLRGEVLAEGVVRENIVGSARVPEMSATGVLFLDRQ
ncbi:MAG: DUF4920 domain-containing protein [Ignavibacteria bacterium]|nr:DUF4920 domain-containing protein [Ignavibacteria bacterium]MBP6509849.1 DUF4920 domain-containing protein [Candidatus Kapabacteria bacterium]MBK6760919.1 DUF4920 domain-containing protein [Ignavibacteria bacterium]MBK7031930.1 DUF4920 domain-containing protein [Ignavibacteria bacterium]MBK7185471.1 DUF4920 domain-containing protein [Ignavibacteria bacterium]